MSVFWNVAAIIRTYNNNADITKSVSRALNNGVGLVIVVVNASDENTRGNVRGWLARIKQANESRLVIIEMQTGYSWSNALNVALAHIRQVNQLVNLKCGTAIDFVLPVSNEVLWKAEHLKAMLDAASSSQVGVVGTSFDGFRDQNRVELGKSYIHPRNTMCLIRWAAILAVGHFDAICDGLGGMEDLYFIMNMVMCGNFVWRTLPLGIKLVVGKNYNQDQKEAREMAAMREIVRYFRSVVDDSLELSARIEDALAKFDLSGL